MRTLLCACTLSLLVAGAATPVRSQAEQESPIPQASTPAPDNAETLAGLQKNPPPSPPATTSNPNTPEQIRKRGADWLAQCLQDWDAATHMTKKDWQRVCRRVAGERINELIKQTKQ